LVERTPVQKTRFPWACSSPHRCAFLGMKLIKTYLRSSRLCNNYYAVDVLFCRESSRHMQVRLILMPLLTSLMLDIASESLLLIACETCSIFWTFWYSSLLIVQCTMLVLLSCFFSFAVRNAINASSIRPLILRVGTFPRSPSQSRFVYIFFLNSECLLYSKYTRTCTCCHFAGVLENKTARSVFEAGMCVSNTLDILVRFIADPPTVRRWIAVQPVGGPQCCRRHFV